MRTVPFRANEPSNRDAAFDDGAVAFGARPLALPFIRRVYLFLTAGIISAIGGALVALYAGAPAGVEVGRSVHVAPLDPLVGPPKLS